MARIIPNDLGVQLVRDRATARREYAGSVMSSAKWRTAINALLTPETSLLQIITKFVGVEDEKRMTLPALNVPYDFFDSGEFGPFPIVAIEWVEVPHKAEYLSHAYGAPPVRRVRQDVEGARTALERTGKQYVLEETSRGLRIIGHIGR